MDLSYSAEDEAFRTELRSWLAENLPEEWRTPGFWATSDRQENFELRRAWERDKALAGFAGIQWPKEYGGRGGTAAQRAIYDEEMARHHAPTTVNPLGLTFLAPTVMAIGTEQQKRDIVKPLLHNEVIWCQGFSEPDAGSDLANIRTSAVLDGDEWVVNGQKIWTTNAAHGDWIFALVRTSQEEKKHRGITMMLIDMKSEGVEARPLKQMSGASEFGEVFFTDVRVPKDSHLGDVGDGWNVAMLLLSFERGASALGQYTEFRSELDNFGGLTKVLSKDGVPAAQDPGVRRKLARHLVELECLRLHSLHILTQVEKGRDLGFEASMTKLQWSETSQQMQESFVDILGVDFQVPDPAPGIDLRFEQAMALWSRSVTIWGGSSQVQRNIVAERVLGLPR
ncbi:MAG: acyl-CoA dehydrogenase protein [Mycobacterium sp.]|nr:acyl-CoA dehydrogenase protein [Mycobacterium sp.]MCW2743465.1 acyl-CoA dehydrogenase protein [Mycobacterium sp.]